MWWTKRAAVGLAWALALTLAIAPAALGIIKVELPVSKLVQQSRAVAVGRVTAVDPQRRAIEAEVTETTKGNLAGGRFRLVVAEAPPEVAGLLDAVAPGAPVVLFVGAAGDAVIHAGDRWVRGTRAGDAGRGGQAGQGGQGGLWRVAQSYDGARSFPGRTAALVGIVREVKAGSTGLQDWVSHEVCLGGVFKRVQTGLADATFFITPDLDGDGLPDVVVGNTREARVFIARGKTYEDQTAQWGLAEAKGARAAAADFDGDGAVDLVIGSRLWVRAGEKFVADAAQDLGDPAEWVALGAGDADGDGKADVALLRRDGRMLLARNPGAAGADWKVTTAPLWTDGGPALAAAFATDFADDGRLHAIVVRADSIARYPADTGPAAPPADPKAGAPAADFARLTGIPLASYGYLGDAPIRPLLLAAYDYDGLGRTDVILITAGGGIALANRGHGAFLINRFAPEQFRPGARDIKLPRLPFEPSLGSTLAAPGRLVQMQPKRKRGNLLVLEKGEVWEMENERKR